MEGMNEIAFPPQGFVDRAEAGRMFGVSDQVFARWHRRGRVRGTLIGRKWFYDGAELNRLREECGTWGPPYPDPEQPGCYRVPLAGSGMKRREAIIDAESLPIVQGRRWNFAGNADGKGFVALSHSTEVIPLRRLIMGVTGRRVHVKHVNGNPLDCRRENLRVVTSRENMQSAVKMGTVNGHEYTSRFKGVSFEKWTGKWKVQIGPRGQHRVVGRFRDEIAAAQAYDEAARQLFGEHARLNFPDGVDAGLAAEAASGDSATAKAA